MVDVGKYTRPIGSYGSKAPWCLAACSSRWRLRLKLRGRVKQLIIVTYVVDLFQKMKVKKKPMHITRDWTYMGWFMCSTKMNSKTLGICFNKIVSSERVGDLADHPRDPSIIQLSRESPGEPGARGLYRGLLLSVRWETKTQRDSFFSRKSQSYKPLHMSRFLGFFWGCLDVFVGFPRNHFPYRFIIIPGWFTPGPMCS